MACAWNRSPRGAFCSGGAGRLPPRSSRRWTFCSRRRRRRSRRSAGLFLLPATTCQHHKPYAQRHQPNRPTAQPARPTATPFTPQKTLSHPIHPLFLPHVPKGTVPADLAWNAPWPTGPAAPWVGACATDNPDAIPRWPADSPGKPRCLPTEHIPNDTFSIAQGGKKCYPGAFRPAF